MGGSTLKISTLLKWVSGGIEGLLGIPFLGGLIILSTTWTPLIIMVVFHTVTLIFSVREGTNRHGSILGIVTNCIGWIPIVGMIMHIITAVILLIDAYKENKNNTASNEV
jgi:hypothetical protein